MHYLWAVFLTILMPLQANEADKDAQQIKLQECLIDCWGVDQEETSMENLIEENEMETFEKNIAYFFGVANEEPVIEAYLNALKKLQTIDSLELLKDEMIPHLEQAYQSVKEQLNWDFDTRKAADFEFQIILGNLNGSSFEVVQDLTIQLYHTVYQSDSPLIQKAAMLRTFLYQYKARLLKFNPSLTREDQRVMLEIARASKEILNSIK